MPTLSPKRKRPVSFAAKMALVRHVRDLPETLTLTPKQFGGRIGREARWVCTQIALRRIRALPGGPPYLIPISELAKFL